MNIREEKTEALQKTLVEKREELRKVSFEWKGNSRPNEKWAAKKLVAQILTELNHRKKQS